MLALLPLLLILGRGFLPGGIRVRWPVITLFWVALSGCLVHALVDFPFQIESILILFTLALTWIAVVAGLSAKSTDGVSAFSYPLIFLPFISSAFVPTHTMPGPVRVFAEYQPVTSIVNAIRDLFAQQPVGAGIWIALAWCVGILMVAYTVSTAIYRRRMS